MSNNVKKQIKLLSINEVTDLLNVSKSTLERMIKRENLPFFKLAGTNKRLIEEKELEKFIKQSNRK